MAFALIAGRLLNMAEMASGFARYARAGFNISDIHHELDEECCLK